MGSLAVGKLQFESEVIGVRSAIMIRERDGTRLLFPPVVERHVVVTTRGVQWGPEGSGRGRLRVCSERQVGGDLAAPRGDSRFSRPEGAPRLKGGVRAGARVGFFRPRPQALIFGPAPARTRGAGRGGRTARPDQARQVVERVVQEVSALRDEDPDVGERLPELEKVVAEVPHDDDPASCLSGTAYPRQPPLHLTRSHVVPARMAVPPQRPADRRRPRPPARVQVLQREALGLERHEPPVYRQGVALLVPKPQDRPIGKQAKIPAEARTA